MLSVLRLLRHGHRQAPAVTGLGMARARHAEGQRRDAGFTLLEVIVSLAVLSISLTLALRTLSGGFHHQQQARTLADATLLAQSLLARVGRDLPLQPGSQNGAVPNGLLWQVQIAPYGSGAEQREGPVAAYAVSVRISAPQDTAKPIFELNSLRLGPDDARR